MIKKDIIEVRIKDKEYNGMIETRLLYYFLAIAREQNITKAVEVGEGVVLAICKVFPIKFGYMKVGFDITLVMTACILSVLIFYENGFFYCEIKKDP